MQTPTPQPGPRLSELMAQAPPSQDAASAPPAGGSPMLSNDASMEAILTSPVHQARIQAELSKKRLERLAAQLAQVGRVL